MYMNNSYFQSMGQACEVAPDSRGWLSLPSLSPRYQEGKIGRGKGEASFAEGTRRGHSQLRAGGNRSL